MITRFLIIVNVIAFLWEIKIAGFGMLTLNGSGVDAVLQAGALSPSSVLVGHEWWRIVTSGFLHAGLLHIGVNMMSLWFLGRFIEQIAGPVRMALIYAVSMVVSGLGVVYLSSPAYATVGTLGASGAIFGLFGALFAIGFKLGRPGMELVKANLGILILNLVITFAVPAISWQAHVSGLIAGFILTYLVYFPPRRVVPVVRDAATGEDLDTEYQAPAGGR
ncbi:MAG TPA: rhomboid family intramembrane serine protease [Candidatus Baltobacteraceae bacterium]|nr:rhomboid family intramembrane serine protease [Candidatus Baltobacteraceae bacterium]